MHGNKECLEKGVDVKNIPAATFYMQMQMQMQMQRRKVLSLWKSLRHDLIRGLRTIILGFYLLKIYFLQDFNSFDLISWDFVGSHHIVLGKKSQESKLKTLFSVTFCPRISENSDFFTKVFISRFFSRNFFSCDFFTWIHIS